MHARLCVCVYVLAERVVARCNENVRGRAYVNVVVCLCAAGGAEVACVHLCVGAPLFLPAWQLMCTVRDCVYLHAVCVGVLGCVLWCAGVLWLSVVAHMCAGVCRRVLVLLFSFAKMSFCSVCLCSCCQTPRTLPVTSAVLCYLKRGNVCVHMNT